MLRIRPAVPLKGILTRRQVVTKHLRPPTRLVHLKVIPINISRAIKINPEVNFPRQAVVKVVGTLHPDHHLVPIKNALYLLVGRSETVEVVLVDKPLT